MESRECFAGVSNSMFFSVGVSGLQGCFCQVWYYNTETFVYMEVGRRKEREVK